MYGKVQFEQTWRLVDVTINLCLSSAMSPIVNEEKKTVTAWAVRTALHRITDSGPNGQYFVNVSTRVIGVVKMHRVRSAMARVAIRVFRAVLISEKENLSWSLVKYFFILSFSRSGKKPSPH